MHCMASEDVNSGQEFQSCFKLSCEEQDLKVEIRLLVGTEVTLTCKRIQNKNDIDTTLNNNGFVCSI